MKDANEIITVPGRILSELSASLIVAGKLRTRYRRVSDPHPTRKKRNGKPAFEPLRRVRKGGAYANDHGQIEAVPCRVSRSKIIKHGFGTITLPRWVAVQAGLI